MKRLVLALTILVVLSISSVSFADKLCFSWSPYEDTADGFRMFKDTRNVIVLDNIPVADTEACIDDPKDTKCVNYFIAAFTATATSGNSEVAVVCPPTDADPPLPTQPPVSIGGFTVRVVVEPN